MGHKQGNETRQGNVTGFFFFLTASEHWHKSGPFLGGLAGSCSMETSAYWSDKPLNKQLEVG